jgi:hypothetical protein
MVRETPLRGPSMPTWSILPDTASTTGSRSSDDEDEDDGVRGPLPSGSQTANRARPQTQQRVANTQSAAVSSANTGMDYEPNKKRAHRVDSDADSDQGAPL